MGTGTPTKRRQKGGRGFRATKAALSTVLFFLKEWGRGPRKGGKFQNIVLLLALGQCSHLVLFLRIGVMRSASCEAPLGHWGLPHTPQASRPPLPGEPRAWRHIWPAHLPELGAWSRTSRGVHHGLGAAEHGPVDAHHWHGPTAHSEVY